MGPKDGAANMFDGVNVDEGGTVFLPVTFN
jgi:hypothetical protein